MLRFFYRLTPVSPLRLEWIHETGKRFKLPVVGPEVDTTGNPGRVGEPGDLVQAAGRFFIDRPDRGGLHLLPDPTGEGHRWNLYFFFSRTRAHHARRVAE